MVPGPPRRRRARPVGDAPIDPLLAHAEDVAKGWLLALLEQAPLDEAPGILAADISRDGPRVCEAVLRALTDDNDLRRLEPGGALTPLASRIGEMAGAGGAEAISRAVDALQAVIWAGLRDELRSSPDPALISELAERLALVTEQLRAAALRREQTAGGHGPAGEPSPMRLAPRPPGAPGGSDPELPEPGGGAEDPAPPKAAGGAEDPAPRTPAGGAEDPAPRTPAGGAEDPAASARSWPQTETGAAASQALWVGALEEEIHRAADTPLSLLSTELEDADRVVELESSAEARTTFSEFAQALRSVVRRQDILVSESDTRAWIIARDTGRAGAQALGARIDEAVRERRPWRGAALSASIGVAVLGEDGRTSAELMDAAEEARFAAAAAGIGVVRALGEDSNGD